MNSGRSPEITSMERLGEMTFELEANIGFCFFDLSNSFGVPDIGVVLGMRADGRIVPDCVGLTFKGAWDGWETGAEEWGHCRQWSGL